MLIKRTLTKTIKNAIEPGKVVVLYGPRRVGKTTLVNELVKSFNKNEYLLVSGDQIRYRRVLSSQDSRALKSFIGEKKLLIVDEAQRIKNIGLNLKIIVDNFPNVAVLATGSASLDLSAKISEPLTGRKKTYILYPLSYTELSNWLGEFDVKTQLDRWLIYGGYPEAIVQNDNRARENYLFELTSSYLYKDILDFGKVKKAEKIVDLLRLLAFQIGREVSIAELSANLALDRQTVEKYLDLLQKSFVIYKISGFSRNLRKEIAKNSRYYFFDNGVRNALIENFNELKLRNDVGSLWENFLSIERQKYLQKKGIRVNRYFWRTYDQKEIDIIEEKQGKIYGYELKWKKGKIRPSTRKEFSAAYPGSELELVSKDNFSSFIS